MKLAWKFLRVVIGFALVAVGLVNILEAFGGESSARDTQAAETENLTEEEYKARCQTVDYKELLRYPEKYEGTKVCVKVKIQQKLDNAWRGQTDEDGYGWYMDDEYYLQDKRSADAVKILVDDVVLAYGEFVGVEEMTRALTGTVDEIPCIKVKYADLVEDKPEKNYEEVFEEYSQKMREATPRLIEEYHEEAKLNANGITGLAEIFDSKTTELAEINYEGDTELSKIYMYNEDGSYDDYAEWSGKLFDVYMEEAGKIQDAYMESAEQ